jgi:F-type H+-transporting ATPase subunit epsilon
MYTFTLVTPEEVVFEGSVYAVIAPGVEGYLEILKDHTPILVMLKKGDLKIMLGDHQVAHVYQVAAGFLEVSHGECTALVDAAEKQSIENYTYDAD